jgi:hypothetical protein
MKIPNPGLSFKKLLQVIGEKTDSLDICSQNRLRQFTKFEVSKKTFKTSSRIARKIGIFDARFSLTEKH